jgi:hypothetical protein
LLPCPRPARARCVPVSQGIGRGADVLSVASFLPTRWRRSAPVWAAFGLLPVLFAVGCAGGQSGSAIGAPVIAVTERDFAISAPKYLAAGDVVLRVQNRGPDGHELIVVRLDLGSLPMRSDGMTVSEEAVQRREVGVLEPGASGALRDLHLNLAPGRYQLFCNMSGHYLSGMHTSLVVK